MGEAFPGAARFGQRGFCGMLWERAEGQEEQSAQREMMHAEAAKEGEGKLLKGIYGKWVANYVIVVLNFTHH